MKLFFLARCSAVGLLAFESVAAASPTFPTHIKDSVSATRAPSCLVCHSTLSGGFGTATTPFAAYMSSRGLKAQDLGSLDTALAAAKGENHDSSGDGVSDIAALTAGTDPNQQATMPTEDGGVVPVMDVPEERTYGCQARVSPGGGNGGQLLPVGVVLILALARLTRPQGSHGAIDSDSEASHS